MFSDLDTDIFHENSHLKMLRNRIFSGYKFFVITIITKHSILDVAAALDQHLKTFFEDLWEHFFWNFFSLQLYLSLTPVRLIWKGLILENFWVTVYELWHQKWNHHTNIYTDYQPVIEIHEMFKSQCRLKISFYLYKERLNW